MQALKLQRRELKRELEIHEAAAQECSELSSGINEKYNRAMRWHRVFMKGRVLGEEDDEDEAERAVMLQIDNGEDEREEDKE